MGLYPIEKRGLRTQVVTQFLHPDQLSPQEQCSFNSQKTSNNHSEHSSVAPHLHLKESSVASENTINKMVAHDFGGLMTNE